MRGFKEKLIAQGGLSRRTAPAVIAIVIVVVVIALFGIVNPVSRMVEGVTKKISQQYTQELNSQMASHISTMFDNRFSELEVMGAALAMVGNLNDESTASFISSIEKHQGGGTYLAFLTEDGRLHESTGTSLGTVKFTFTGDLLNGKERVVSESETVNDQSYILLGTTFHENAFIDGKRVVAGILGQPTEAFADTIELNSSFSGGYASIIANDGSYIVKNSFEPFSGLNAFSILSQCDGLSDDEMKAIKGTIAAGESCMLEVSGAGEENSAYLYMAPVESTDWYIINCLPTSFIRESVTDLQNGLTLVAIFVCAIIAAAAAVVILMMRSSQKQLQKSQDELAVALQAAEDASHAKTAFLNNMSHDIRTPMNAIIGMTNIAMKQDNSERTTDCLEKISNSSEHLLNLINDVLDISRIESGKVAVCPVPVELHSISDAALTIMHGSLSNRDIKFIVRRAECDLIYVMADALRIREVLVNLMSNAVKFTEDGGTITFTVELLPGQDERHVVARYIVSDTGIGMSPEFVEKIFEEFSQEGQGARTQYKGTGLGMTITKKYTEMMGGTISVTSEKGVGSTFIVEIPFELTDAIEEAPATGQAAMVAGLKVLLAEDNDLNAEIAIELLQEQGMTVDHAVDGKDVVEAFAGKPAGTYDLILMDIMMPVMDGYEATHAIRAMERPDAKKIPIIAMTANAFAEDVQKVLEAGMDAHLAKPIVVEEVVRTISANVKR